MLDVLRLADLLGIPALPEIACPAGAGNVRAGICPDASLCCRACCAHVHIQALEDRRLAGARGSAAVRGLATVVSGGKADRAYLDGVWREADVARLDGKLAWPELSGVIGAARVYVGPDTAVTHLAAATGTQTVALFGPTNPRIWGPWPVGGLDRPWAAAGTIQNRGNVWLVQNPLLCLPCQQEGCARRLNSHSQCLDELPVAQVLAALDQALAVRQAA